MGEEFIRELLSLCLHRLALEQNTHSELELIEVVRNFEVVRKKWLHAELELKKYKELLVKSDVARAALEVKLKHARNQVDVEIKKRYKVEADYQYLERQMLLMTEILAQDSKSNACLNEEQRNMLASFHPRGANITQHRGKRLSVIDESSFLSHSDISYDRTDDDLDLDSAAVVKPLKSRPREKRRSSLGPIVGLPIQKRGRLAGRSGDLLSEVEATVVTASVTTPDNGGQIHMVIDITQEMPEPIRTQADLLPSVSEQTSVWAHSEITEVEMVIAQMDETSAEPKVPMSFNPTVDSNVQHTNVQHVNTQRAIVQHANVQHNTVQHVFLPKTVIRPETCTQCKKRIRFGKVAVKCRDCRVIAHPECKHLCLEKCFPNTQRTVQPSEETLEGFCPSIPPRIPALIVQCVKEIERRGLEEKGLYRVPGGERAVKELRERYLSAKGPLLLHRVDEIHVVCGLLKDFLRKLREPLVTFKLHKTFMEAAELADDDNSSAMMIQAIGELPQPNRETLAFLILHLQRVTQSPQCQMDQNNLARVFGPTIIGHGMSEPSPLTIMRDTNTQPKVVLRLLSFPADYWKSLLTAEGDQPSSHTHTERDQPRSHTHTGRDQPRSHTHTERDQPRSHTHFGRDQPRSHTHPERDQLISSVIHSNISSSTPSTDRDRMFKPVTSPELSKYSRTPGGSSIKGRIKTLGNAFNNPTKPRPEPAKKKFFTSPK
ncbi:rac GTPase-activating protein 1 isoform X2 [Pangasianodon hypophthalmus]|uniref:rac GTPase-activating protein 1 isoform X2 n=1 Tax=Pangasianodon hypophthalmus TaxID=310915 RepID=UPI00230771AF|nr:rac GTPase-activating protein 1 isoform X2 [Pangasianodon hypophthalmus]